jgi:hypothetical protein
MELSQLFSRGTKLEEVPADFVGMPMREWQRRRLDAQSISPQAVAFWKQFYVNGEPPINKKKILTPQDTYGMKGVLGR